MSVTVISDVINFSSHFISMICLIIERKKREEIQRYVCIITLKFFSEITWVIIVEIMLPKWKKWRLAPYPFAPSPLLLLFPLLFFLASEPLISIPDREWETSGVKKRRASCHTNQIHSHYRFPPRKISQLDLLRDINVHERTTMIHRRKKFQKQFRKKIPQE